MDNRFSHIRVALDGPSGAGKSTIAKEVAKRTGLIYVDTGALYRTVGLYAAEHGISADDTDGIISCLPHIEIKLAYEDGAQKVYLNGSSVGDKIRTENASYYASAVSKIPEVRAFLLGIQKKLADEGGGIMDGRDIGTVVLPDADLKIYLTASAEERARRRCLELSERGTPKAYEEVLREINERDYQDMHRDIAPLREAADAVHFDTSKLNFEESERALLNLIQEKLK